MMDAKSTKEALERLQRIQETTEDLIRENAQLRAEVEQARSAVREADRVLMELTADYCDGLPDCESCVVYHGVKASLSAAAKALGITSDG